MRLHLVVPIALCIASAVDAQRLVSGLVSAEADGMGLPCLDVALIDSAGEMHATARTFAEGVFQLPAGPLQRFRLRFSAAGMLPVTTALDSLSPSADHEASYRLRIEPLIPLGQSPSPAGSDTLAPDADPSYLLPHLSPRFPRELERRLENGTAVARLIVDTTGRVRPGSVVRVSASHPAFFNSARDFLQLARFRPARRAGEPVCALMVQTFLYKAR